MHVTAPRITQSHHTKRGMHALRLALSGKKTASATPIPNKQYPKKDPRSIRLLPLHELGSDHDNARFQFQRTWRERRFPNPGQLPRNGIFGNWLCAVGPHSDNAAYRECPTCNAAVHSGKNFREVGAIRPEGAERGKDQVPAETLCLRFAWSNFLARGGLPPKTAQFFQVSQLGGERRWQQS
jgi:hypothetical protein